MHRFELSLLLRLKRSQRLIIGFLTVLVISYPILRKLFYQPWTVDNFEHIKGIMTKSEWESTMARKMSLPKDFARFPEDYHYELLSKSLNLTTGKVPGLGEKVVFLVPYRRRARNLLYFLYYMHTYLRRIRTNYEIFLIAQDDFKLFRRGNLFNVGVLESMKKWPNVDCFCLHDVDNLPLKKGLEYKCPEKGIRQLLNGVHNQRTKETLGFYSELLGGVTMIRKSSYVLMNGMSNSFDGWGGEDDNFYIRAQINNVPVDRTYQSIFYTLDSPEADQKTRDPNRHSKIKYSYVEETFKADGFNSTEYRVKARKENVSNLFSMVLVNL